MRILKSDIELRRGIDGKPLTNVPHRVIHHSPTGFEWGYGGSGPADLAYNILLLFLPEDKAWALHHDFKWRFIARIPYSGGVIKNSQIRSWISKKERCSLKYLYLKSQLSLFEENDN